MGSFPILNIIAIKLVIATKFVFRVLCIILGACTALKSTCSPCRFLSKTHQQHLKTAQRFLPTLIQSGQEFGLCLLTDGIQADTLPGSSVTSSLAVIRITNSYSSKEGFQTIHTSFQPCSSALPFVLIIYVQSNQMHDFLD